MKKVKIITLIIAAAVIAFFVIQDAVYEDRERKAAEQAFTTHKEGAVLIKPEEVLDALKESIHGDIAESQREIDELMKKADEVTKP